MYLLLERSAGVTTVTEITADGAAGPSEVVDGLAEVVARREPERPRWVWDDTNGWYPEILASGVRIERCVDLRLSHAILRGSSLTSTSELARSPTGYWDRPVPGRQGSQSTLFEVDEVAPESAPSSFAEFRSQRDAIDGSTAPARIGLLIAAESAGALVAAEIRWAGLPWRADIHEAMLTATLGPRPPTGVRPHLMAVALERVRAELGAPELNPDSPPELMKALARAGIAVESTRSWELEKIDHPAIAPLLEYKKLARLFSANGWHWLDTNVVEGRFHPDYVPGGVVTGRWASKGGGGALQLPRQVRGAVLADPGWKLVVADAAQLEPRILAAMSADRGMAAAGARGDLYAGIVASGAVDTRERAKVAVLGAMYGATSGEAGRLMPRLARAYPRAIALVEDAARSGERGESVTTWLGRSSPPGASGGYDETATETDAARARTRAKGWGRFTRNFVVQGTAAEWALCWMAGLRVRLRMMDPSAALRSSPHLVFFMHDEIVVHTPEHLADVVVGEVQEAAADAGRLMFALSPVDFPLTVAVVDDYSQAK